MATNSSTGRAATADEIAEAIVFLATDRASFIHGAKLAVDGGRTAVTEGSRFHVDVVTPTGFVTATTVNGTIKTWSSLDAAAKWVRSLGLGTARLNAVPWQPVENGRKP